MSATMWKLEKDLCRCCHAEGSFKHLSDPCFQLGQEEIYSDMLQDCLNIKIVPMTGVLSDVTYTICESCVVRLRDASNFKKQVQDCEERFKEMYSKNLIRGFEVKEEPAFNESDDMKQEFHSVDEDDDDAFMNFDDDPDDADDSLEDRDMITIGVEPKPKGKGKAKPKPKTKKPAPAKKTKAKDKSVKLESEDLTVAAVSGEKKKGNPEKMEAETALMLKCPECTKMYKNEQNLTAHIQRVHLLQKCPNCSLSFTKKMLRAHLLSAHEGEPKKKRGPKFEEYNAFVKIHRGRKTTFTCTLCDFKPASRYLGVNHVAKNHSSEVSCPICAEIFTDPNELETHKSLPHSYLKYPCSFCGLDFPSKGKLETHKKRHSRVKCRYCPEKVTRNGLKKHLLDFHEAEMPTCGVCGLKGVDSRRIEKHQRMVHLKEKNVTCDVCNFECFSTVQLKKHMISHRVDKVYECRYCKKKFPRHTTRKTHEMIHTGEKNKVCSICNAAFVQKASLNYHMMKKHPEHV